jgi:hypothetical protein
MEALDGSTRFDSGRESTVVLELDIEMVSYFSHNRLAATDTIMLEIDLVLVLPQRLPFMFHHINQM